MMKTFTAMVLCGCLLALHLNPSPTVAPKNEKPWQRYKRVEANRKIYAKREAKRAKKKYKAEASEERYLRHLAKKQDRAVRKQNQQIFDLLRSQQYRGQRRKPPNQQDHLCVCCQTWHLESNRFTQPRTREDT